METLFELLETYGTQLAAVGASISFVFGVYKFQIERETNLYWKEFDTYHRLIKELVAPDDKNGFTYVDRQAAVLYELRFYERYYPLTKRMLNDLKQQDGWNKYPRLITEMDSTLDYINQQTKA